MIYWLINHSWESFKRTQEYCGFVNPNERDKVQVGDKIAYFGNGIVFGLFEAIDLPDDEFKGWEKKYPFQVKIKPIIIAKGGVMTKPLADKISLQKAQEGSSNLVELSENEFNQIKQAIEKGEKELKFS